MENEEIKGLLLKKAYEDQLASFLDNVKLLAQA